MANEGVKCPQLNIRVLSEESNNTNARKKKINLSERIETKKKKKKLQHRRELEQYNMKWKKYIKEKQRQHNHPSLQTQVDSIRYNQRIDFHASKIYCVHTNNEIEAIRPST